MTRDIHTVLEDPAHRAESFTALWAAAQFPRLPSDAPAAIRSLTIDVHEPAHLLKAHSAYRRHGFQSLVLKYIPRLS
jgi:hypothetical protein